MPNAIPAPTPSAVTSSDAASRWSFGDSLPGVRPIAYIPTQSIGPERWIVDVDKDSVASSNVARLIGFSDQPVAKKLLASFIDLYGLSPLLQDVGRSVVQHFGAQAQVAHSLRSDAEGGGDFVRV